MRVALYRTTYWNWFSLSLPFSVVAFDCSAGGLVTAVAPVVIQCGGRWVGWTGDCTLSADEEIPESSAEDMTPTAGLLKRQVVPVHLDQQQFDSYYNGCCNGTLWPLFHSMSDRAVYSTEYWQVNLISRADVRQIVSGSLCVSRVKTRMPTDRWQSDYLTVVTLVCVTSLASPQSSWQTRLWKLHKPISCNCCGYHVTWKWLRTPEAFVTK